MRRLRAEGDGTLTRILNIDGERVEVKARHAMIADASTYKRLTCGDEITVSGDPYYQAGDGRTWCIFCVRELEER